MVDEERLQPLVFALAFATLNFHSWTCALILKKHFQNCGKISLIFGVIISSKKSRPNQVLNFLKAPKRAKLTQKKCALNFFGQMPWVWQPYLIAQDIGECAPVEAACLSIKCIKIPEKSLTCLKQCGLAQFSLVWQKWKREIPATKQLRGEMFLSSPKHCLSEQSTKNVLSTFLFLDEHTQSKTLVRCSDCAWTPWKIAPKKPENACSVKTQYALKKLPGPSTFVE